MMKKDLKANLSVAVCALLSTVHNVQAETYDSDTELDNSIMYYSEKGRISVTAPQISLKKTLDEDNSINASLIYDTITGATPTGEVPYGSVQTVTSASGRTSTVSASTKPSINLTDHRTALNASWKHQLTRLFSFTAGLNHSSESDYLSNGVNLAAALDSEDKLTTLSLGLSSTQDDVSRNTKVDGVSGIPAALTDTRLLQRQANSEPRSTHDIVIGLTQVLSPKTLVQFSLSQSQSNGYLNDPYKLISVVDNNGIQVASYYESRPDNRQRKSLYTQLVHNMDDDVMRISFRLYDDDWNIQSSTLDLKYRINLKHFYFEPHLRLYHQSAASFHQYYLKASDTAPDFASADARLASFTSNTFGLSGGYDGKDYQISARLEMMAQQSSPDNQAPGNLKNYDLFNGVNATIAQVNFTLFF